MDICFRHKKVVNHIKEHHKKYLIWWIGLCWAIKAIIFVLWILYNFVFCKWVKAIESNSLVYKSPEQVWIVYEDTIWNLFPMWTITIFNEWKKYEILDRDLWANELSWFWYYFQWWNNYWFSLPLNRTNTTSNKVDASDYWPGTINWYYVSNSFYDKKQQSWDSSNNQNLRWDVINTNIARQWPCPEWYHIPTTTELQSLYDVFLSHTWMQNYCNNAVDIECFFNVFYIWKAWEILPNNQQSDNWTAAYRYSSSMDPNSIYAYSMSIKNWTFLINNNESKAYWKAIRCFSNDFDVDLDIYTVIFDSEWWNEIENIQIEEWSRIEQPDSPIKDWYSFMWWYVSWTQELWNFETDIVTWDIILYAKWLDIEPPMFDFKNNVWYECTTGVLQVENLSDNWGLSINPISFDWINFDIKDIIFIAPQKWNSTKIVTWYVSDLEWNIATKTAVFEFLDTWVVAESFVVTNVWDSIEENWKVLSNANEWDCWNAYLFAEIKEQWLKWLCSIFWDEILYQANLWEKWEDLCEIRIYDMENNYTDVFVKFTDIFNVEWILESTITWGDIVLTWIVSNYEKDINYYSKSWDLFVIDYKWLDKWRYTMISVTNLTWTLWLWNYIDKSNVYLKINSIYTITWDINDNIKINTQLNDFVNIWNPILYMYRDSWINNRKIWEYWSDFTIKVNIPIYQLPDTYIWNLIFTIYENE